MFDEDNLLVGILVRGDQDYDFAGGCVVVNELPETGGRQGGEAITYAFRAVEDLCADGYPSERLCNIEVECGDDVCSLGESFETCPEDCDEPEPEPDVPDAIGDAMRRGTTLETDATAVAEPMIWTATTRARTS